MSYSGVYPTVEEIQSMTRKQLVQLSASVIRHITQDPAKLAAFEGIVNSQEGVAALTEVINEISQPVEPPEAEPEVAAPVATPAPETLVQELEKTAQELEAIKAAEARRLRFAAEDAEFQQANITVTRDENGKIIKYVKRYQAMDENNHPIGLPTHLEAASVAQLSSKQQAAHENALRLAERIKKQKITHAQNGTVGNEPLSQEKVRESLRTLQSERPDSPKYKEIEALMDSDKAIENQLRAAALNEKEASLTWRDLHKHDFNPCAANAKLINSWIIDNNLDYSVDNLEVAFLALQSQLVPAEAQYAPVEQAPAPVVNETPQAAAPVVNVTPPTPLEAPTPQVAAVAAPAVTVAPNKVAPARRPGLFGGIQPGTLTASRPVPTQTPTLTKKDIARMKPQEIRRRIQTEPGFEALMTKVINSKA